MIIPALSSPRAILHHFQLINTLKAQKAARTKWLRKLKKIKARARNARIRRVLRPFRPARESKARVNPISPHLFVPLAQSPLKNNYKNF